MNANRRLEYAALQGEEVATVRGAHNSARRTVIENETDAERETRMTNLNASRRDLRFAE